MADTPEVPSKGDTSQGKIEETKKEVQEKKESSWTKNLVEGAVNLGSKAANEIASTDFGKGISSAFKSANNIIGDSQQAGFRVEEIGKPFFFNSNTDPNNRTYNFLATRMNIVDLYPCNYAQSFLYNKDKGKSLFKYGVTYKKAMEKYGRMCTDYIGEAQPPGALRIYLTDDTTSTDGITTNYEANFFQKTADSMSNKMQGLTSIMSSLSSNQMYQGIDTALNSVKESGDSLISGLNIPEGAKDFLGGALDTLKQGASIILKGNKLSLPKIWNNSSYRPNFSISTKLFSPYGSPKAIKEYIVKPLVYLLLLASPHTDDMISYGRPFAVTVRSWGTGFLTLGGITSLTLQRGGSDTVYNIYKQPLIINVNMNFESLTEGLMAFGSNEATAKIPIYEKSSFSTIDQILPIGTSENIDGSQLDTVVPTVGGIIRSLQPVTIEGLTTVYGPNKSTREDVMIGGNGFDNGGNFGLGGSIMSSFNAALGFASSSADGQAGFGSTLLGGVSNLLGGVATGVGACVAGINETIGTASQLANIVTLGAYGNSSLAKTIGGFQNTITQNSRVLSQAAGAVNTIKNGLDFAQSKLGSLFNMDTKKKDEPEKP